jgi:hypothetical protein
MNNKTNPIKNLVHGVLNKNISILYLKHNTLFDSIFKDLSYNTFVNGDINNYYYDMIISNNPLSDSNECKRLSNEHHINEVLFFHNAPPENFKKEDIAIFHQNTAISHKIFMSKEIYESWKIKSNTKSTIIDYGIPDIEYSTHRNKSILILNLENNPQIDMLYNHIQNTIPESNIIKNLPGSVETKEIIQLLSQYKICIDLSSSINMLLAISCGCQCITPFGLDSDLVYKINDYSNLMNNIQSVYKTEITEDQRRASAKKIKDQFNYDKFESLLNDKITQIKNKEVFTK